MPPGYGDLLGRLLDVAAADDRVLAVWLGGSLGRGVADPGSDLDVVLTVTDEAAGGFAADGRGCLGRVTTTVLVRELPGAPGSWHSLTPDCERLGNPGQRRASRPLTP
ncbi:MAG TPA: nucleotidyltransferase domain-containing protein [Streptosporangiaceae bacterium]